jgi:AcrR family transcriptional regulator
MATARAVLASNRASARREREREIVAATRLLFDERGLQDAPIEEIARAVGINKALIYRHFSSKEELYVLTLTSYLTELAEGLENALGEPATYAGPSEDLDAVARLERGWRCYTDFCLQYPAFVDCGLSLMREPAAVLRESVSDSIWMRLGLGMAACLGRLSQILAQGAREGAFEIEDADFMANHLYTQTLGTMQLARIGIGVRASAAGGLPEMFEIDARQVQEACIADVLAAVGASHVGAAD